jgi:SAM-dependent methyltransferase
VYRSVRGLREKINRFGSRHRTEKQDYDEKYFSRTRIEGSPVSQLYMKFLLPTIFKNVSTLLDAGCGTGECIRLARKYGKDAVGIDVSPYAAQTARQILGNVVNMPFKDRTFDAVVAFEVLEHLILDDAICFMKECYRVLREGGSLALSTPNWLPHLWLWLWGNADLTHKVYYNFLSVTRMIEACRFRKIEVMTPLELKMRLKISIGGISILTLLGLGMIVVCKKSS